MATKKKNWFALVLTLVIVGLYYALVFVPSRGEAEELRQEMEQMRSYITSAISLPVSIHGTNEKLARTDRYISDRRRQTPGEEEIPRVFAEINRLARQAGVVTTHFDPEHAVPMQTMSKVPVSLGITGSFNQVSSMLHKLERLQRPIWIESLQIELMGKDEKFVECEIKLIVFASNSG